ncbi:hypothetical protein C1645_837522 [Glomus cerebriforme]|uniref:Uncharacterized protein n=1 Tax=Glomus cerebriforme TaxID=658196 RepID=A0A397SAT0_9GLOM|nr:hypothetical protein C1645_837522 [Glomus cerebriforme]
MGLSGSLSYEVAAPNDFTILDHREIAVQQPFLGQAGTLSYFITWISSYVLSINGRRFATLATRQQQAVELDVNFES